MADGRHLGGRPPSWISIFGHNFSIDQHFCTKFGTVMENHQAKVTHWPEIRFSKIQDGGRPPLHSLPQVIHDRFSQ